MTNSQEYTPGWRSGQSLSGLLAKGGWKCSFHSVFGFPSKIQRGRSRLDPHFPPWLRPIETTDRPATTSSLSFYAPCNTERARKQIPQADVATCPEGPYMPRTLPRMGRASLSSQLLGRNVAKQKARRSFKTEANRGAFFLTGPSYRSVRFSLGPLDPARKERKATKASTTSQAPIRAGRERVREGSTVREGGVLAFSGCFLDVKPLN